VADVIISTGSDSLPVGSMGHKASGWWGMLCVIATEASVFIYLLFSYFYFAIEFHQGWVPDGPPSLALALPNTAVLIASSLTLWWGERSMRRGEPRRALMAILATIALGAMFVGVQLAEWHNKTFSLTSHPYGSVYFTTTGFHMVHVVVGLIVLAALAMWTWLGYFDRVRHAPVSIGALYWHFVDAVWVAVFFTFYVTPYLS